MRFTARTSLTGAIAGILLLACGDAGPEIVQQEDALASAAPPSPARLLVNEVLANEPGNDDGAEFVEIVNTTDADIDLEGYTVWDRDRARHTFHGVVLGSQRAIVVFGGAAAIPAGLENAVASSTGKLDLGNASDTVSLKDASGAVVDTVT